jgi:putative ABC transport system permease protein
MLSPRWHKVLRDLWINRTRTLVVVFSISVGVCAVGAILNSQIILDRDLKQAWSALNPASASIVTLDPFDDELVNTVRHMKGVSEAEGRRSSRIRVRVGPQEWKDLQVFAIPDYDDIRVNIVRPQSGPWPPPKHEILIERASLELTGATVGETIHVKTGDGLERDMRIAGMAHDPSVPPVFIEGTVNGYVTFDTLEWLGEPRNYNELYFVVAGQPLDKAYVQSVALRVEDKVEGSGRAVSYTMVPEPGQLPFDSISGSVIAFLGLLGFLALLLSGFLVVNTISAMLRQQVRQIGVMKAIGARSRQIAGIYLVMVLLLGILSLGIAVPLAALGARLLTGFIAGILNVDLPGFTLPWEVVAAQAGIAMLVPVVAALKPIVTGTRITVRQAVTDYGLGQAPLRRGLMDWLLEQIHVFSRPVLLSLRNTFRRKGRLALTLITLVLGGAIFISVFSVHDALLATAEDSMAVWRYDLSVTLNRPYRESLLENEALKVPGVVGAKAVGLTTVRRLRPDDTEGANVSMMALPLGSDLIRPIMLQGRWLVPEDENAIVVTTNSIEQEPDLKVGDTVTFRIDGRKTRWKIVGIAQFLFPYVYTNYPYYARAVRNVGRAEGVVAITEKHDAVYQAQVAQALETHFERSGVHIGSTTKIADKREETKFGFNIIVMLMLVMAVLIAIVGGFGLMGTMSINVLERMREIGVMRAIGASDGNVAQVFIVEGLIIGLLSWLLATLVAVPLSRLLTDAVGTAMIQSPLHYQFSWQGVIVWWAVVVALSFLASVLPARSASRVTVREVLAYE